MIYFLIRRNLFCFSKPEQLIYVHFCILVRLLLMQFPGFQGDSFLQQNNVRLSYIVSAEVGRMCGSRDFFFSFTSLTEVGS